MSEGRFRFAYFTREYDATVAFYRDNSRSFCVEEPNGLTFYLLNKIG